MNVRYFERGESTDELFVTAADLSKKNRTRKTKEEEEAFVKNKRVTQRRAKKEEPKSSIFMIQKKKKNYERVGLRHAQRDSTKKLSATQTTDVPH